MNQTVLLVLVLLGAVLAFALGIWIGLGYPGLYEKYEATGRAPRKPPFEMLVDWIYERLGR